MVAVTQRPSPPIRPPAMGVVPTASTVVSATIAAVWLWIPLTLLVVGISSIPSVIGFAICAVVFLYLMRGVERVERIRSEAVFGLGIGVPDRRLSHDAWFQRWLHQLGLDASSARFWKGCAHHFLRSIYDLAAVGLAFALVTFAFLGPAAAIAINRSDAAAGLSFLPPVAAVLLAVPALIAAAVTSPSNSP